MKWLLLAMLLMAQPATAIDPLPFKDRAEEVRFQNLTKQLRCLVCQNQDLADSDADLAKDLRQQVFTMMQSGKSDAEIKQFLVSRYNDFVLYDPPLKRTTWLLWFGPFVLLVGGGIVWWQVLQRRQRASASAPTHDAAAEARARALLEDEPPASSPARDATARTAPRRKR